MAKRISARPVKEFQISFPSMDDVRKMVEAMQDQTNNRRDFHGGRFTKQVFCNSLIMGVYEIEANDDLDLEKVKELGLLATVIDRGADSLSRSITSDDKDRRRSGRIAARSWVGRAAMEEEEEAAPARPPARPPWRSLAVPADFLDGVNPALGRAHREDKSALND